MSRRAEGQIDAARADFSWVRPGAESVVVRTSDGALTWWPFGGMNANTWLAVALKQLADQVRPDDLGIRRPCAAPPGCS